jgi:hypothetical protein
MAPQSFMQPVRRITRSEEQFSSGQTIPSKTVLDRLRKR